MTAISKTIATAAYSPQLARERLLRAWLLRRQLYFLNRVLAGEGFTGQYDDRWIGPVYRAEINVPADAHEVVIRLRFIPKAPHHQRVGATLTWKGRQAAQHVATAEGVFGWSLDVRPDRGRKCRLEIRCDSFFVPRDVDHSPDDRWLSMQLIDLQVVSEPESGTLKL